MRIIIYYESISHDYSKNIDVKLYNYSHAVKLYKFIKLMVNYHVELYMFLKINGKK